MGTKKHKLIKQLFLLLIMTLSLTANGQTIVGLWETYDDKTNDKKAIIEIYKKNNLYFAKIVKSFVRHKNAVCKECKAAKKDKPIIGLVIIENIKKNGKQYDDGTILDPETGEQYSCYMELINKNKLKVRGFLGFSILGRTQYWLKKE